MLVELGLVEQRTRRCWRSSTTGAPATDVARPYGCCVRRCTRGSGATRSTGCRAWPIGRAGRSRVHIRCGEIELWAEHWNDDPQPFVWKMTVTRSPARCAEAAPSQSRSWRLRVTVSGHRRTPRLTTPLGKSRVTVRGYLR
jgi:hypothetical protein